MDNYNEPKPIRSQVTLRPDPLADPYYTRGTHFPLPDEKQQELGSDGTVNQSERQKDAGLNASEGVNGASIRGAEGKPFLAKDRSKTSVSEEPTHAGKKAGELGVNLVNGQISSNAGDARSNRLDK